MNKKADEYKGVEPEEARRGISLRNLKTFESFKTPAYRIYFASMVGNWAAMSMQMMVRFLLIYRLTGSATLIGVMALANAIPALLVALLAGAIADRIQKKYILLAGRAASAVFTLAIAVPLTLGYLSSEHPGSWWLLIVCAVLQGTTMGFIQPANMAIIPEIVGKERVMNAMSLSHMGGTVFGLVGPAFAGYFIDAYGFATIYYLMAGMYLVATICIAFLPRTSATTASGRSTMGDILDGLRHIRRETIILLIAIFGLCHMISGQPYQQLLPIFTEDILKVGASGMGILLSVSSVGSLLGSLVLASLPNRKRGFILILSGIVMGLAVMVFSYSRWWYLSLAIIPFAGLGPTMHSTMTSTLVQSYTEPNYRARTQSVIQIASGLASFGTLLVAVLSDAVGIRWAVGGAAILLTLISIAFLTFAPQLRKLD